MKKRILTIALVVIMAVSIIPSAFAARDLPNAVGVDVSKMNTTDTMGNVVTGDIFKHYQLTVLNFWATWCGPCIAEMPHFQTFYEEHLSDGINLMGVILETNGSTVAGGNKMAADMGLTYTHLRVDAELDKMYMQGFQGTSGASIPDTYLINDQGKVISAKNGGFADYEELETWVMSFWNDPTLESVSIPKKVEVGTNRMVSLTPELTPKYAMIDETTWSSSDEKVATVSESGLVTGLAVGTATITVTLKSGEKTLSAECTVTVKESEELEKGTVYYKKTDEIGDGLTYAVVVNYGGEYYMMSSEGAVDGRYRLIGAKVDAKDMMLIENEDGKTEIAFLNADNANLWSFYKKDNGFSIANAASNEYLSTVRANGTYRLSLKSKDDVVWTLEKGMLKNTTKNSYTGSRQYLTYYADTESRFVEAFDLLEKDSKLFTEVMYFEKSVVGGDTGEVIPGDLNGNGMLDAGDATMVLRHVVGTNKLDAEKIEIGDMNKNGGLDSGDASIILRAAVSSK